MSGGIERRLYFMPSANLNGERYEFLTTLLLLISLFFFFCVSLFLDKPISTYLAIYIYTHIRAFRQFINSSGTVPW